MPKDPPRWTQEELERDRGIAIERVIARWERTARYVELFHEVRPHITALFEATDELRELRGARLQQSPRVVEAARYLSSPVLSADDLRTLARGSIARTRIVGDHAERVAAVLRVSLDPIRHPWLAAERQPTGPEREAAIDWTAGVWAANKVATEKRLEAAGEQEEATVAALREAGYVEVPVPSRELLGLDGLDRGRFARETLVAGTKCDIPVRLSDGRLLALECKVANSAVNSIKRLNHEIGDKTAVWRAEFGAQVIPGAVLAGVFKLTHLHRAQSKQAITLFWEHSLSAL
ncbi:MAG: XamI family restriction endonuclease [Armatimonadetes bacterium]|nr:XamI family restriction endonuclease [Armatimonadota bacterium]